MSCAAKGTSYYDCDFEVQSGRSVDDTECEVNPKATDVRHIVKIIPRRQKYHKIRVTGRVNANPATANAKFTGATALSDIEWQETKNVSTVSVVFDSATILFVKAGTQDIETKIEEQTRWNSDLNQFNQIDQNDLTIVVDLK